MLLSYVFVVYAMPVQMHTNVFFCFCCIHAERVGFRFAFCDYANSYAQVCAGSSLGAQKYNGPKIKYVRITLVVNRNRNE